MRSVKKNPAAAALGRKGGKIGGRVKSEAKSEAARVNGANGGRPPLPRCAKCGAIAREGHMCADAESH